MSVATVLVVIVCLDTVAGLIDQLSDLKGSYDFIEAILYVLLKVPSTIYEYLPLSSLVGCLIGLGVLASSSENPYSPMKTRFPRIPFLGCSFDSM